MNACVLCGATFVQDERWRQTFNEDGTKRARVYDYPGITHLSFGEWAHTACAARQ